MAYEVPPLPYDFAALEPHIDARTMEIHHDKHHQAYVEMVNAALVGTDFDGAVDYNASASIQAGWMWRDPARRLSQFRVFGQYYTGYSPYGQFYDTREDWFGFGLAMDY